jgi:tRNA A-37 threonylcarbamoyl transferase component Bud32
MADVISLLADRYRIEREIGRGGTAVVYLAHDLKHDRAVALKMLLPQLAANVGKERFLREIQIAAKLVHSRIVALYDSGESDGQLYYVMPFVEGESLRNRMNREQQLPLDEALRITRDIANALAYAHDRGVVHRDIKPENVLLHHGDAMVTDFGIARALAESSSQVLTLTGIVLGTPHYMSPEQAAGSSPIDGRSDVYSLGCVLYEMLAGHPPFSGKTTPEILARHALDPMPRLSAARPDVPELVETVLRKALAKSPAQRFGKITTFAAALDIDRISVHPYEKAVPVPTNKGTDECARTLSRFRTVLGLAATLTAITAVVDLTILHAPVLLLGAILFVPALIAHECGRLSRRGIRLKAVMFGIPEASMQEADFGTFATNVEGAHKARAQIVSTFAALSHAEQTRLRPVVLAADRSVAAVTLTAKRLRSLEDQIAAERSASKNISPRSSGRPRILDELFDARLALTSRLEVLNGQLASLVYLISRADRLEHSVLLATLDEIETEVLAVTTPHAGSQQRL